MARALRMSITLDGARPLLSALGKLDKNLQANIRDASQEIAATEADRIAKAGRGSDKQSRLVAVTVRARRDRVPAIAAGGAKRLPTKGRPRAMDLLFGAEFGGQKRPTTQQFRPHKGTRGYWFFPTIRRDEKRIIRLWLGGVDKTLADWDGAN